MRADLIRSKLTFEVHFDFVCPWCWIGRRNQAEATRRFQRETPALAVETIWHGQQLLPETPLPGLPYQAFYEHRLGGPVAAAELSSILTANKRLPGEPEPPGTSAVPHFVFNGALAISGAQSPETLLALMRRSVGLTGLHNLHGNAS